MPPRKSSPYRKEKKALMLAGRKLTELGLLAGLEGNLSLRVSQNEILITRSGCAKSALSENDLLVMDTSGKLVQGKGKISSEKGLHLFFHQRYPEKIAVIHAHPPAAIAWTLAGLDFDE